MPRATHKAHSAREGALVTEVRLSVSSASGTASDGRLGGGKSGGGRLHLLSSSPSLETGGEIVQKLSLCACETVAEGLPPASLRLLTKLYPNGIVYKLYYPPMCWCLTKNHSNSHFTLKNNSVTC